MFLPYVCAWGNIRWSWHHELEILMPSHLNSRCRNRSLGRASVALLDYISRNDLLTGPSLILLIIALVRKVDLRELWDLAMMLLEDHAARLSWCDSFWMFLWSLWECIALELLSLYFSLILLIIIIKLKLEVAFTYEIKIIIPWCWAAKGECLRLYSLRSYSL